MAQETPSVINEVAVVTNVGSSAVDIGGWTLLSTVGNQTFKFPANTEIAPGTSRQVLSGPHARAKPGAFVWDKKPMWRNDGDDGQLIDLEGRIQAEATMER